MKARWPFSPMPTNATSIGAARQLRPTRSATRRRLALAVEQVVAGDAGLVDQPLQQVSAEAGRVIDRQTDVLVEVKHLDARPVDAGHPRSARRGTRTATRRWRRSMRTAPCCSMAWRSERAAWRAAARLIVSPIAVGAGSARGITWRHRASAAPAGRALPAHLGAGRRHEVLRQHVRPLPGGQRRAVAQVLEEVGGDLREVRLVADAERVGNGHVDLGAAILDGDARDTAPAAPRCVARTAASTLGLVDSRPQGSRTARGGSGRPGPGAPRRAPGVPR